jgi:serine/threonine-protein kinase RsbW
VTSKAFHMPNRLDAIDPMVLTLKGLLEGVLSQEALCRFDICLSETLANLVLHAKTKIKEAQIEISLTIGEHGVKADIFDPEGAQAFDIRDFACDLSEVDVLAERGRGLGLIMECADAVDYGMFRDRNRLSLSFIERV